MIFRLVGGLWVLISLVSTGLGYSQDLPDRQDATPANQPKPYVPADFQELTQPNTTSHCLEPPPLPGLSDYNGPMEKTIGLFARPLERKSVTPSRYRPGVTLCSLGTKDKFILFVEDSTDPITFLSAGFDAAMDHASNRDPSFGQGPAGYAKRFSTDLADRVSAKCFIDFAYPTLFSEDPRYYRLGQGRTRARTWHAVEHLWVAHRPDGAHMFNYSRWLGVSSAVALSNVYHPGEDRSAGAMARTVGYRFAWNVGSDVLREFWPDIVQKFRLPFRGVETQKDHQPALDRH